MSIRTLTLLGLVTAASPAFAQPAEPAPPPTPPTPPTAPTAPTAPTPPPPPEKPPVAPPPEVAPPVTVEKMGENKQEEKKPEVKAKYDLSFYGFVEFDSIWDSTQGLGELSGNTALARPGTYQGEHGQTTFTGRNSRIGMKLAAPVTDDIKATAQLEMDFLGNQPPGISEAALFQNPTFRFRHMNLKLETKPFDVLIGQYWQLFGWQSYFHPNTVDIQGIPGQIYSRAPQVRVSKLIKGGALDVEVAVAAARPPSRASQLPDGHAGVKLLVPHVKAWRTVGSTASSLDPAALGVSFVGRRFSVDEFSANPTSSVSRNGYGVSVDGLLPIISATKDSKANALTLTGSFVYGAGIADLYTGLSGGVSNPALPNPMMLTPAPVYTPNVDNGLVMFQPDGTLHPIQWTSYIVNAQYYLPPSGKVWLAATYSHMSSANAHLFGAPSKVWDSSHWLNADVMWDVTSAVRLGVSFDWFRQTYVDGVDATNYRLQGSAFFLF